MQILRDKDQRFKNLEKKVGIFVIASIIAIFAIVIIIGIEQDVFTSKSRVYFYTTTGTGIFNGMTVKLSGFKIGKVEKITLDDNAMVKVVLSINAKYMKWIKVDSKAYLKKEDLIGDSIIEISRGSNNAVRVSGDALIPFEREKGLEGIASDLQNEIKPVITNAANILEYINNPNGELKQTLVNVKKISAQLSASMVTIDSIIKTSDKNVPETFERINTLLQSTKKTVDSAGETMQKASETMKKASETMEKTDKVIDNLEDITSQAKKTVPAVLPAVPHLMKKGERLTDGAIEIVDSLKQIWPISLKIKQVKEDVLPVDSYE